MNVSMVLLTKYLFQHFHKISRLYIYRLMNFLKNMNYHYRKKICLLDLDIHQNHFLQLSNHENYFQN